MKFGITARKYGNGGELPDLRSPGNAARTVVEFGLDDPEDNQSLDDESDDNGNDEDQAARAKRVLEDHTVKLRKEFTTCWTRWVEHMDKFKDAGEWRAMFPRHVPGGDDPFDLDPLSNHMRTLPLQTFYKAAAATGQFWHLPLMKTHSRCAVGALAFASASASTARRRS